MSSESPSAPSPSPSPSPSHGWKRVVRFVVGLALFVTACVLAWRTLGEQGDVWDQLKLADGPSIAGLVVALTLINVTNGVILRDLVAHFGVRLTVRVWLGITLVSTMLNLVSPIAGAGAMRAVYLNRTHAVPLTTFASMMAASTAFSLAASATLAAASLVALGVPGGRYGVVALAASVAVVIGVALALALAPATGPTRKGLVAKIALVADGWRSISRDRRLLAKLAVRNISNAVLHAVAFVLAFRMAGFDGDWLVPVTSSAFARIGALIAITPAGLGIFEAFGAVSAGIVGASPAAALLGVLIVRVFGVLLAIAGGAAFSPFVVRPTAPTTPPV